MLAGDDAFATNEDTVLELAPRDELIPLQSIWQYLPANGDPTQLDPNFNTTWYTQQSAPGSYVGPPFFTGIGSFDYGGVDAIRLTHLTQLADQPLFPGPNYLPDTVYFVIPFEFSGDPALVTELVAEIVADDGAFLYLNGAEVGRINMGAAADTYAARATTVGNEFQFTSLPLLNRLQTGTNYLAVSVHNVNFQGADLGFDMRLVAQSRLGNLLDNDASDAEPPLTLRVSEVQGQAVVGDEVTVSLYHGMLVVRPDGTFRYTPAANVHGNDTFTYRATDGVSVSDAATVTITVYSVNDAPVARFKSYRTDEDVPLVVEVPPAAQYLVAPGATWEYFDELDELDYPRDSAGRQWFEPAFDAATSDPEIGSWKSGAAPFAQGVIDGFAGQAATPLVGTAETRYSDLFRTQFEITEAQALFERLWVTFLSDDGGVLYLNGQDVFRFQLPPGPVEPNFRTTQAAIEEYVTQPINTAGVLHPGVNTLAYELHQFSPESSDRGFDMALSVTNPTSRGLLADATDVENHVLTASLVEPPQHGTVVLEPSGRVTYTPDVDFYGIDEFTYRATDDGPPGGGGVPARVTVHVLPRPDSLVAQSDSYAVDEDQTLVVHGGAVAGVLANDFSNDGPLVASLGGLPSHGQLTLLPSGNFEYAPQADFFGTDTFTYYVTDAIGDFDEVPVTITVQPVNDPPAPRSQLLYRVREDRPLRTVPPDVSEPILVVPQTAIWDYTDQILNGAAAGGPLDYPIDAAHPELDWNDPGFSVATSDIAWSSGAGPFVAGRIDGVPVGAGTVLADRGVTTYLFRTSFVLSEEEAASIQYLDLAHLFDDGAAMYVNGHEVGRFDLPAGPLSTQTLATRAGDERFYYASLVEVVGWLVPGVNTLAIEIHDGAANDLVEYLRVSEIMYNPPESSAAELAAGFGDEQRFEYLELVNISSTATLDLSGTTFSDGIELAFGAAGPRLAPGERGVVVSDEGAFRARYGDGPRVIGQYAGRLSSGGERLRLDCSPIFCRGRVFEITYFDDEPGWHPMTDGEGYSLVVLNPALNLDLNEAASWQPSGSVGGSPSAVDAIETDGRAGSEAALGLAVSISRIGGVSSGATDVEGDGLSAVLIDPPDHGEMALEPDGTFVYTPHRNFFGTDTFVFSIVDDNSLGPRASEPTTVTITVLPDSDLTTCEDLDWDRSGTVGRGDLAALVGQFGTVVEAAGSEGDFNGDGKVGLRDLVQLRNAFGEACGSAVGPTPAAAPAPAPAWAIAGRAAAVDRVLAGFEPESDRARISSRRDSTPALARSESNTSSGAPPSGGRQLRAGRSRFPAGVPTSRAYDL